MLGRVFVVGAAVCVSASCWPTSAAAAEPPEATVDSPAAALAHLRPGQHVRLAVGESETVQGRLAALRDGRVIVKGVEDGPSIEAIREVWVRRPSTKKGALIGGGVGAVVCGAGLGFFVYALDREAHWKAAGVFGTVAGGAAGALTGAAIGSAFHRWERVGLLDQDRGGLSVRIKATKGLSLAAAGSWDSGLSSGLPMIKGVSSPGLSPLTVSGGATVSW
jgi:hypothetical protein